MKSRFLIIALGLFAFACTSCTKTIYEETTIEKTVYEELHPTVVLMDVPQKSWNYSAQDNNNYFYATIQMPEITEDVFDKGLIKVYRTFDFDKKDATQIEMPYIRHKEFFAGKDEEGYDIWGFYTETVDYEIQIGKITICYTTSDFDYEIDETFVPEVMSFRAVIYK